VPPTFRQLLAIGSSALLLRLLVFLIITLALGHSFQSYIDAGDGISYQAYARHILGEPTAFTDYDARLFPGYPILIAATHLITRLPIPAAALAVTWISAALAAVFSALLFRDHRVGWAMVMFIPHWPINSSLIMGEAPLLALATAGLLCGFANWRITAGFLLGMSALVRPVALFPLLGLLAARLITRNHRDALLTTLAAGLVAALGLAYVHHLTGNTLQSLYAYTTLPSAYGGHLFAWPFQALIETPIHAHASIARITYIYAHVLLVLSSCILIVSRITRKPIEPPRRQDTETGKRNPIDLNSPSDLRVSASPRLSLSSVNPVDIAALIWLLANFSFTICIGSGPFGWGFYHFPRFTIPGTPAIFYVFRRALPSAQWIWLILTMVMLAATVLGVHNALITPPPPRIFAN
jgi:hypothetical protein